MTNKKCPNCGKPAVSPNSKACTNCGKAYSQTKPGKGKVSPSKKKTYVTENTVVVILLSMFFPGAGQVYNGQQRKGLIVVTGFWVGMFLLFIPAICVWIYSIYDAYNEAKKISAGEVPYVESTTTDINIYISTFLALGIIFIVFTYIGYFILTYL